MAEAGPIASQQPKRLEDLHSGPTDDKGNAVVRALGFWLLWCSEEVGLVLDSAFFEKSKRTRRLKDEMAMLEAMLNPFYKSDSYSTVVSKTEDVELPSKYFLFRGAEESIHSDIVLLWCLLAHRQRYTKRRSSSVGLVLNSWRDKVGSHRFEEVLLAAF